jgi:cysteinyl-tRNA synthetase
VLELDRAILAWSADTLQSDEVDRAHAVLRGCVVRLGEAAGSGLVPAEEALGPLVTPLVALRQELRADREFALSDRLRDLLSAAGVVLRDTPDGPDWSLAEQP